MSLTFKEKQLIDKITSLMTNFEEIRDDSLKENSEFLEKYEGDWPELCVYIHQLQNWVLSNSASRMYSDQFRPFGCKFKEKLTIIGDP